MKCGNNRSNPFSTSQGVKQGDPLSPFLFGIFVEILHEMLEHFCPSAGIKIGTDTIFDMLYADDCTLIAETPEKLQLQLDVVKLFGHVCGMKLNVRKTEIMVFRRKGMKVPVGVWRYDGTDVKVVESAVYLGSTLHAVGTHHPWQGKLRVNGLKASFALQGLVKKQDLYAPELQLRLFDTLVQPVMSYGCQIWGAAYAMHGSPLSALDNSLQRIHLNFLRVVSGASNHVPNVVLLHEFKAAPLVCHWLRLVLRFWNRMVGNKHWLLHSVFQVNVSKAVHGLKNCWAAQVLGILLKLGEISSLNLDSIPDICSKVIDVDRVVSVLHTQIMQSLFIGHTDPRTCPSIGAKHCAYMQWFAHADQTAYHPHIKSVTIPSGKHRELMRFRLGCSDIAVNSGRFVARQNRLARADRVCPCCSSGQAEDELHVIFECTAYDIIRSQARFVGLFSNGNLIDMKTLFCHPQHQSLLADLVRACSVKRKQLIAQF